MKKYIVIPARFNSKRLPGKVLKKIGKTSVLKYLVDKLHKIPNVDIIVATSLKRCDQKIYNFCNKNKIKCFRGPLNDLAYRLILACEKFKIKYFARINGDSPLIDVNIINKSFNYFKKKKNSYDFFTNIYPRSYPIGQSVEIYKLNILKKYYTLFTKSEKEHVGKFFYKKKSIKKFNFQYVNDYSNINMSINNYQDFINFKNVLESEKFKKKIPLKKLIKYYK